MTKIEAIVGPSRLDDVKRALDHAWITGITVTEVKGRGGGSRRTELVRGSEHRIDTRPELKVEVVVPDPLVPRMLHELERSLRTGRAGDGKVFVTRIEDAVRVRTGERGEGAL